MSRRAKRRVKRQPSGESRSAEVLTIGWMLTVITALACELAFVAASWLGSRRPGDWSQIFSSLMLFAALVVGFLALLLTPVVAKTRRVPPPRGVTIFAILVGALPLITLLAQALGAPR